MRRLIQCASAAILLASVAMPVMAGGFDYSKDDLEGYNGPNQKSSDADSSFARDGKAVYFFTGYAYVYRLWSNSVDTITSSTTTLTYQPSQVFSKSYSSFEAGIGKEWSRHFDFQLAYLQYLSKSKTKTIGSNTFDASFKMNGLLTDLAYIFNPDSQFQVSAKVGVVVAEGKVSIAVNGASYYPVNDSTQIEPALGIDLLFGITPSTGIRVGTLYVMNTQNNSDTHGDISAFIGLNHTL